MAIKKKQNVAPKDMCFSGALTRSQHFYGRTEQDVEKKAEAYFGRYHPMGYSTKFEQPVQKHVDGYWFCVISRYNSCD